MSWSGCVRLVAPPYQKVKFTSATPDASIVYKWDTLGIGTATGKMDKRVKAQAVMATKQGYISASHGFELKRKLSPVVAVAVLDCAAYVLAPIILLIDLMSPKVHLYDKQQKIHALVPQRVHQPNEMYLVAKNIADVTAPANLKVFSYGLSKHYKRGNYHSEEQSRNGRKKGSEAGEMEHAAHLSLVADMLMGLGYTDTSRSIFQNARNTLYVDVIVKNKAIHQVHREERMMQAYNNNRLVSVEMEVEWKVYDYYRQPILSTAIKKTSDLFLMAGSDGDASRYGSEDISQDNPLKQAVEQVLQLSFKDLLSELDKKEQFQNLKKDADTSNRLSLMMPAAPGKEARLNEMLRACVTLKVSKGHGSGVIVSEDGYIVTNYHVIAGSDSVEVIFNDDSKVRAKIEKTSPGYDLALLKVERTGLRALPLAVAGEPEIGVDVWTMGAPTSLELGQSISRGIISGTRTSNDLSYLQLDAKVSPGNSGGALIDRTGQILGIVTAKLIGKGAEGVAFATPARYVLEQLGIRYKQ